MEQLTASEVLRRLGSAEVSLLELLEQCRHESNHAIWGQGAELCRLFAQRLLKQGHPSLALEVARRGLSEGYPNDPELEYCRALALARCDSPTRAAAVVRELVNRNDLPAKLTIDALSLAGRVHKDFAARAKDPNVRTNRYRTAWQNYQRIYDLSGDPFPGINAASMALLAGNAEQARTLAAEVRHKGQQLPPPLDYWMLATLGEACLLLGDIEAAHQHYHKAVTLARASHAEGNIGSMGRQLLLLRDVMTIDEGLLSLFNLGPIVIFAGHGLDYPGGPVRFPADALLETAVREAIAAQLNNLRPLAGYCVPGNGSSTLFGELMRERGAELHMVLPFAESDFIAECVTYNRPELESWHHRYHQLRGPLRSTLHHATKEPFLGDNVLYDFAGLFMQGLGSAHARRSGTEVIALVVRDESATQQPTGVERFLEYWHTMNNKLCVIDLGPLRRRAGNPRGVMEAPKQPEPRRTPMRSVKAMLFADVAGFSGLAEEQLPNFFLQFLTVVEQEIQNKPVLLKNTWGDGLYLVFPEVLSCAEFALGLLRRLEQFDFAGLGFSIKNGSQPGVRIGLHTGPVFEGFDAVMGKTNYFGSHVSRAARIEPVTAPGCAFASEQFAAALSMTPGHRLVCEYLGLQPLAKNYDVCALYRLADADDGTEA